MAQEGKVIPASVWGSTAVYDERSIGNILIHDGRLTREKAQQILRLQREQGLRFGDAAIQLGFLSPTDIEFALSRQFQQAYLEPGESKVSEQVIAAYDPLATQVQALGALRSQLMLRWFDGDPDRKVLAIVSAARGDGRSFLSANLAVTFSQLGRHTLLIDADLRNPSQHKLFGIGEHFGLSAVLSGRSEPQAAIYHIPGLPGLTVMPAGVIPPNPLDLLARPLFPQLLNDLAQEFDVILIDSPSAADYPDAQTIAIRAGAALIVARKNATRMWQVRGVSETVSHASTTIVGTVLNDF